MRNLMDALRKSQGDNQHPYTATTDFLDALRDTKPGERENVVIETIEPE